MKYFLSFGLITSLNIFSNVSIKIVDEARHEVFSETTKENSYNTLIKFIES